MPLTALPCIMTLMMIMLKVLMMMMTVLPLLVMMMMLVTMITTCPDPTFQISFSIFHDAFPLDSDHLNMLIKHLDLLCITEIITI